MESKIVSFIKRRPFGFGFTFLYYFLWLLSIYLFYFPLKQKELRPDQSGCGDVPMILMMIPFSFIFIMGFLVMIGEKKDPQHKKDYRILSMIVGIPFLIFILVGFTCLYINGNVID